MRRLVACLAAFLWAAPSAWSAEIGVLPVGLSLSAARDRGAITVSNRGKEPVVMQVQTVAWTQSDGQDRYQPSRDLLVNPPLFKLPPGGDQVLRVGLRQPPGGEREAAYRLFLREVPSAPATGAQTGVRVLLELRLPVYVEPARPLSVQQWSARHGPDGGLVVEVFNTGNVHLAVRGLTLRAAGAAADTPPLATLRTHAPVLPDQRRRWALPLPAPATGQRYVLEVTTDRGTQNVVLEPERG